MAFYVAALEPLGYKKQADMFDGKGVALGAHTSARDFSIVVLGLPHSDKKELTNTLFGFRANGKCPTCRLLGRPTLAIRY